jgi:hypothetical protein
MILQDRNLGMRLERQSCVLVGSLIELVARRILYVVLAHRPLDELRMVSIHMMLRVEATII